MRKRRKVYKKILEKLPTKLSKRGAKVMYKFVSRNKAKSVNGKHHLRISKGFKI